MRAVAALGNASTPTPSGTFYLGTKYRWVRFTYSQTPHSICYRPGRYIHGLPCYTSDIAAKVFRTERELGTFLPVAACACRLTSRIHIFYLSEL